MADLHPVIHDITQGIIERSRASRNRYLAEIRARRPDGFARHTLSEGNQAHAAAGCILHDKTSLFAKKWPNIGIVTAYNDMLSAHQPFEKYPEIIRKAARKTGATAQVAGGVPAMCDGVTQGRDGMELSLFSRDVIAMGTGVALSHDSYDAALYLGVCDKIVPGLLIGALNFGHIPGIFIPAGPMPSGLPNPEKARIRQLYAAGKVGRDVLLKAESESYHSPGTCTFYGTANSNQMLMEIMGLHLPGAAFVHPNTPLRQALTEQATRQAVNITAQTETYLPIGEIIDERAIVNAIVGLMATGGSTNHTLHIPAIAQAAGLKVTWDDFDTLSKITPLLTRIYPNGPADVNHFHASGGMGFLIKELLEAGLLHGDIPTVTGQGLQAYTRDPYLDGETIAWREPSKNSGNLDILRPVQEPFKPDGGLRLVSGNLGRGIIKISAVKPEHYNIKAPARVFDHQDDLLEAFKTGTLNTDVVIVVRFQGPAANGMPELHKLTPSLGVLQDKGFKVALVTDGRMSGASGKVPAAIHLGPEASKGGMIAKIRDGDILHLDAVTGSLELLVAEDELVSRTAVPPPNRHPKAAGEQSMGHRLFAIFRDNSNIAELGGSVFKDVSA